MRICTIIAKNYVPFARVLATSFSEHHPEGTCSVLVIDDLDGYLDPDQEPFELITPDVLAIPEFDRMTIDYDVLELSTAVKPFLLRHLLSGQAEPITYLDPDIEIFEELHEVDELAREHGIVLIPHLTAPLPRDGKRPSDWDILLAGTYNLGFITLANAPHVDQLLDWWSERMATDCIVDPEAGQFVDQRWIDLVPNLVPDVAVLRDPGYDVAYWNLPTRELQKDGDGYRVDGRPLRFFHFSGFDPRRPDELSKHQDRLDPSEDAALGDVCRSYAKKLLAAGYADARRWPYSYPDRLGDGTPLTPTLRRLLGDARQEGIPRASPFTDAGAHEFIAWLNTTVGGKAGAAGVTRFLAALHAGRSDLRAAFGELDGDRVRELVGWAQTHGRTTGAVPDSLTPLPERFEDGTASTDLLKDLAREAIRVGAVSFPLQAPEGHQQLLSWLNEPGASRAGRGVTRYLRALHGSRSDLRKRFADLTVDADGLVSWAQTTGLAEGSVPPSLVPVPKRFPDGTPLDERAERLARFAISEGAVTESLWSEAGFVGLVDWLAKPAPGTHDKQVTRCLYEIWRSRPDLQNEFPDPLGVDSGPLVNWAVGSGRHEHPLLAGVLGRESEAPVDSSTHERPGSRPDDAIEEEPPKRLPPRARFGVNVTGYLNAELGVGEAGRRVIAALDAGEVPLATFTQHAPLSRADHHFATTRSGDAPFPINLICVNADMLPVFAREAGEEFFAGRYSIGQWFWEVTSFPEAWHESFGYLDEVWVASEHVAEALRPVSPIPVSKITLPITLPRHTAPARLALGLPDGFLFLFTFDYLSVFRRKNPLAIIEAFASAFSGRSDAALVMKCINAEQRPSEHEELLAAADTHPDIHVVDRYLSPLEKNALTASCDCYVSLHRAEGFGFGPAEAMYLGKPVIATAYSGNLDYMTETNSYLVDYELVPIGPDAKPYPEDGEWAEPDVEHSAALMREVCDEPELSRRRGQRGAEDIRRTHSPAAVGAEMRERIERVAQTIKPSRRRITASTRRRAAEADGRVSGDAAIDDIARRVRDLEVETAARLEQLEEQVILREASGLAALRAESERLDDAFAHAASVREAAAASARLAEDSESD